MHQLHHLPPCHDSTASESNRMKILLNRICSQLNHPPLEPTATTPSFLTVFQPHCGPSNRKQRPVTQQTLSGATIGISLSLTVLAEGAPVC